MNHARADASVARCSGATVFLHRRAFLRWAAATLATASPVAARAQSPTALTVAAASDLKFALEEVRVIFERQTGYKVRLVLGSSGNFYSQILQGAPFHVFMSADEEFVLKLADAGKTRDRGRLYAYGRIGIMVPHGSPLKADGSLKDLGAALRDGRLKKFAIANPEHAPYGMRAREALQHAGLWSEIQPFLVLGENISQTAQFATSGSTQGGIIALSLALSPQMVRTGSFDLIPAQWHQPLAQRMAVITGAPPQADAFYDFIALPDAQAIMKRYGFEMPR